MSPLADPTSHVWSCGRFGTPWTPCGCAMEASKEKRRMIAAELKAAFGAPAFAKLRAASTGVRGC